MGKKHNNKKWGGDDAAVKANPEPAPNAGIVGIAGLYNKATTSLTTGLSNVEQGLGKVNEGVTAQKNKLAGIVDGNVSNLKAKFDALKNAGTNPVEAPTPAQGGRRRRTRKSKKSKSKKNKKSKSKKSKRFTRRMRK